MPRISTGRAGLSLLAAGAAVLALFLVTALSGGSSARAATMDVSIKNNAFNPSTLTVNVGDTVHWSNDDSTTHTVTSGTSPTPDGMFNSTLAPGATFDFTFTTAGTFNYFCMIHPFMMGTITVMPAAQPSPTARAAPATPMAAATATPMPAATATAMAPAATMPAGASPSAASPTARAATSAAPTATAGVAGASALPKSGTGPGSSGTPVWPWLALGAALLAGGGGALVYAARRNR